MTTLRNRGSVTATSVTTAASSSLAETSTTAITVNGRLVKRVPTAKPSFTLADIRRSIPAHCFERSLVTSYGYIAYDLAIILSLGYLATKISTFTVPSVLHASLALSPSTVAMLNFVLQHALWIAYWIAQGCVMTGMWVIGHECGHGGFANSALVNDVTGWIIHSALLVPYFSWQISHRRHHSNTASLEHDEVFVPTRASTPEQHKPVSAHGDLEDTPLIQQLALALWRWVRIGLMLTVGWPLYLLINSTGNLSYEKNEWVNHFSLNSPIYKDIRNGSFLVLLSDIGLAIGISVLAFFSHYFSFSTVVYYYLIPYLITNLFLVLITFLQHTDQALPHYDAREWDWLRGALATVDRDYGILNSVFHHINDTHVAHHLFSNMPHYHALEATECIKKVLGPYYLFDDTPIVTALYRSYSECEYIKPDPKQTGVHWF